MRKREVKLIAWLDEINAKQVSFARLGGPSGDSIHTSGSVTGYMVNGQNFFVRRWDSGGWDIYVAASYDSSSDKRFAAAKEALGI